MSEVSYFVTPYGAKMKPDEIAAGIKVLNNSGIPFEFGLSGQEAREFSEDELKRAGAYISKYYDEIFGPNSMNREARESSIESLKGTDPTLYKVLQRMIGRHKWSRDYQKDGKETIDRLKSIAEDQDEDSLLNKSLDNNKEHVVIDENTGYQPGRGIENRIDMFNDKRKEIRSDDAIKSAKERSRQSDINAVAKQDAAMSKDINMDKAKESLDRAKARGDLASVGYKSEKQGGGLSGRSQGQLNQLRKTFVKNLLNTEKYPENTSILEEFGITDNDKDALLTFLKGPKGDSMVYGDYMDKFLDPVERTRAIFEDYKKQGKTDDTQSAILAGMRRM